MLQELYENYLQQLKQLLRKYKLKFVAYRFLSSIKKCLVPLAYAPFYIEESLGVTLENSV